LKVITRKPQPPPCRSDAKHQISLANMAKRATVLPKIARWCALGA